MKSVGLRVSWVFCFAGAWQTVYCAHISVRDLILYRRECQYTLRLKIRDVCWEGRWWRDKKEAGSVKER